MKPARVEGVVVAELPEDEVVVSSAALDEALVLNASGAAVLDLCDGTRTIEEIVDFVVDATGADPNVVDSDVRQLIDRLLAGGIVRDAS